MAVPKKRQSKMKTRQRKANVCEPPRHIAILMPPSLQAHGPNLALCMAPCSGSPRPSASPNSLSAVASLPSTTRSRTRNIPFQGMRRTMTTSTRRRSRLDRGGVTGMVGGLVLLCAA
eukprot:scaffold228111_cov34-Tisochrysis_lutea.AAC.5